VLLPALIIIVVIAYIDWKYRRIPNSWLVVLLGWAASYAAFSPEISFKIIAMNVVIGLTLTLPGYIKGIVGGGDVKLMLAISPLWPPMQLLSIFSAGILSLLLLMAIAHFFSAISLTKAHYPSQCKSTTTAPFKRGVPLGSAIALGAIVVTLFRLIT
jgi:prepilin peptidase CpaA